MDSPSQRQTRSAYADAPSTDMQAFPHGSSAEVRTGLQTPSDPSLEKERPMRLASSAPSMERRGVVAPSDGLIPASVTMPHNNVRSDGLIPDVSQKLVESQDLPDEELRLLLNRARVSRWTDHIMELGAVCIEDVAMTSAEDLAPPTHPVFRVEARSTPHTTHQQIEMCYLWGG